MNRKSQKYLGTKGALVLCVDGTLNSNIQGKMFHLYTEQEVKIYGYNDFFAKGERLFRRLGNPKAGQSDKDFDNNVISDVSEKEMRVVNLEENILDEHGEKGTFIVRVQQRQHSSWQGRVTWVDQDKTVYFRSELELIKLIDGAINQGSFEKFGDVDETGF